MSGDDSRGGSYVAVVVDAISARAGGISEKSGVMISPGMDGSRTSPA